MPPTCSIEFLEAKDREIASMDVKIAWAKCIIESANDTFSGDQVTASLTSLPDLTVRVKDSKNAELSIQHNLIPYSISDPDSQYPAHFRIPTTTLRDLPEKECMKRALHFALGSLIYTIMAGKPPFVDFDEDVVQQLFESGVYPDETKMFPLQIVVPILAMWSEEFAQQISQQKNNGRSTMLAVGLGVAAAATLVFPVLGIAGFSVLGPTAGSIAAAWQSSIGLVQSGSLFAWCQSVAMGGAAAGQIAAVQGVGLGVAALGGYADKKLEMGTVWSLFTENVRKM
ncbi:hypothetical protein F5X99DRAFT_296597 [Biscogniauxia marginata]|nr:hypothetical protein F5X99DRAFT_296597 [Biscogniauxia marginata]